MTSPTVKPQALELRKIAESCNVFWSTDTTARIALAYGIPICVLSIAAAAYACTEHVGGERSRRDAVDDNVAFN